MSGEEHFGIDARFAVRSTGELPMLNIILILLIVAAVAALLGFGRISGAALTGAKFLIGVVLVLFLLVVLGLSAVA